MCYELLRFNSRAKIFLAQIVHKLDYLYYYWKMIFYIDSILY
jgi:hypothetical protein